jgi:hypothetical protein
VYGLVVYVLAWQIEEKKRKKDEEKQLKLKQDMLDEERIKKEIEQEEKRYQVWV